jgi:RNA polymerase sigma factor (sigma-70 family)
MTKRFETTAGLPNYFREIHREADLLTKEEEKALALRIQAGDQRALDKLVTANLKFVVTLANKFVGLGLPIDDLIQEGNAGLIEAAVKFSAEKDVKFISYAQFWIRKRLNTALCEYGRTVRLPLNQEYDIYKRKMAGEEINLRNVELDRPIDSSDEGSTTIGEVLCSVDPEVFANYEAFEKAQTVKKLLSNLKDDDRHIVELFYGIVGDGLSVKEIAEQTGKTASEVGRSLKVARAKMRNVATTIDRP